MYAQCNRTSSDRAICTKNTVFLHIGNAGVSINNYVYLYIHNLCPYAICIYLHIYIYIYVHKSHQPQKAGSWTSERLIDFCCSGDCRRLSAEGIDHCHRQKVLALYLIIMGIWEHISIINGNMDVLLVNYDGKWWLLVANFHHPLGPKSTKQSRGAPKIPRISRPIWTVLKYNPIYCAVYPLVISDSQWKLPFIYLS